MNAALFLFGCCVAGVGCRRLDRLLGPRVTAGFTAWRARRGLRRRSRR